VRFCCCFFLLGSLAIIFIIFIVLFIFSLSLWRYFYIFNTTQHTTMSRTVSFATGTEPPSTNAQSQPQPPKSPFTNSRLTCPNCGSRAIEQHEASGASICTECGIVVEENAIVSSVEFVEGAGGSSSMVGQFVSATSSKAYTNAGRGGRYGFSRDSRETTLANGRRRIQEVASRLRLSGPIFVDGAHRLYTIAVEKNFVQGRRSTHVVAACLYIACRQEKSQHMLIDFSDALQVNVYTLGTCFLKFRRLLGLQLEIIDPALYVYRFAAHLELDGQANAVALTALRLVARMKRDWIVAGRRPAGICAAALLIAARAHGFSKHSSHVTRILKVCGLTVQTRVKEFERTDTARLTLEQFNSSSGDLQKEADPPIFTKNRIREARAKAIDEGNVALLTSGALDDPMQTGKRAQKWRSAKKMRPEEVKFQQLYESLETELVSGGPAKKPSGEEPAEAGKEPASVDALEGATTEKDGATTEKDGAITEKDGATTEKDGATTEKDGATTEKDGATTEKDVDNSETCSPQKVKASQPLVVVEKKTSNALATIPTVWKDAYPKNSRGKAIILPGYSTAEEREPSTTPVEAKLSLEDWKEDMPESIDDEIDNLFRSDQEQRQMEVIFNKINKDYLVTLERKETARKSAENAHDKQVQQDAVQAEGHARYKNKNRRGQTTEEQLMAAVSNRKVSRKINYDALSSIFDDSGTFSTDAVPEDPGEPGVYEIL
jgi:transcription initiation factor TFIIIB Brf1 subunit/transcription initiation factor TFIIB